MNRINQKFLTWAAGFSLTYQEAVAACVLVGAFSESSESMNWITPNTINRTVLSDDGKIRLLAFR